MAVQIEADRKDVSFEFQEVSSGDSDRVRMPLELVKFDQLLLPDQTYDLDKLGKLGAELNLRVVEVACSLVLLHKL